MMASIRKYLFVVRHVRCYRELNGLTSKAILRYNCCNRLNDCRNMVSEIPRPLLKKRSSKVWRYTAAAVTGGAIGFVLRQLRVFEEEPTGIPPAITPLRSVKFASDTSGLKLTLYQYQTCPSCSKVRAFLNFHGISYGIVEVSPIFNNQIKFSKWKSLPILMVEDKNGVYLHFLKTKKIEMRLFGTNSTIVALAGMKYGDGNIDQLKHDARQSLYRACREWTEALGQKRFIGGEKPNLADVCVYGVLNTIEGCAAFQDLKAKTKIYEWYDKMKHEVESHTAA